MIQSGQYIDEARAKRRIAAAMLNTSVDIALDLLAEMMDGFAQQADKEQDWPIRDRLWKAAACIERASEFVGVVGATDSRPCLNYGGLALTGDTSNTTLVSVKEYLRHAKPE